MTWRKIEQQLVEFFRAEGIHVDPHFSEAYVFSVLRRTTDDDGVEWTSESVISLSKLAQHLARDAVDPGSNWRSLGETVVPIIKRLEP